MERVEIVGVDTGGTFTDVFAADGTVLKVPSSPQNPAYAVLDAVRRLAAPVGVLAHGTTVATNAVLERKGARTALLTTEGFEDVLEIRRQNRPSLYDLRARWPDPLVPRERRYGVRERLDWTGTVLQALDEEAVPDLVARLRDSHVEAIAITLLFSYTDAGHERRLAELLAEALPGVPISLSSEIAPQYGEYERTSTAVVNAYVLPVMEGYLRTLEAQLEGAVERLFVMQSNGGLAGVAATVRRPVTTILSGPAGGVVGAVAVAAEGGYREIVTLDMGGTSTDVAVAPGEVLEIGEGEIGSFPLLVPMLTIETVGAGGGSIARVDAGGGLHVGPQSAGAVPGPAARGGDRPTVTDANLVLGRLSPRGLLGGELPLDMAQARDALGTIAAPLGLSIEEAGWAVVRLANSNMERAVRTVTLQRGYDPRRFTLFPFGGAGPLHAAELAHGLGMSTVLVPPHPGVMAALGLTVPPVRRDFVRTVLLPAAGAGDRLAALFEGLEDEAWRALREEALPVESAGVERWVDLRYAGQSFELRLPYLAGEDLETAFARAYDERYGYATPGAPVEVVTVRLRLTLPHTARVNTVPAWPEPAPAPAERDVWFGNPTGAAVHAVRAQILWRPSLAVGTVVEGPAVLDQYDTTTLLPPGWRARVDDRFNLILEPA